MINLADLRAKDLEKFRALCLKAFKRLGYSVWLSEKLNGKASASSILLKNDERSLVQCSQDKGLVDISLIKDFCQDLKKKGIESGFFITTGVVRLADRAYLSSEPVDFIDAKKLPLFLETIFGEDGLKKEVSRGFERREFPRIDLRGIGEDKILWQANTFYGTTSPIKGEIADISSGGIGFESLDEIPVSSLLKLELFLYGSRQAVKSVARLIWEKPRGDSLAHNFGLSFFLIGDKDKERISDFIKSQLPPEPLDFTKSSLESNGASPEFLLKLLVEKNIIGKMVSGLHDRKSREVRRMSEVDIKKAENSIKRFFKKVVLKKCKILDLYKTATGWEALAKKIDDWFEKRGYREVYEKTIYLVRLDDKFKVLSYSKVAGNYIPKSGDLIVSPPIGTDKIREIVKEVAKEISGGNGSNIDQDTLKKIAAEAVDELEKRRKGENLWKKEDEEVAIKESYMSPLRELKIERNFGRIGKVKRGKKDIESQVDSLRGVKKGKHR